MAVFFRRLPARDAPVDVAPAHRALAEGRYETAVTLLEGATRRQRRRSSQAQIKLYLAATYALYGPDGFEWGEQKLREAAEADHDGQGRGEEDSGNSHAAGSVSKKVADVPVDVP